MEVFWDQTLRFFSFGDPIVRVAVAGCLLLGLACGLMGSFIMVRRLSLFGDTLSHAVLPGVAMGFIWNLSKDPVAILIGAVLAGYLGVMLVRWLTATTRLKEDAAMGMVLAGFYGLGVCLLTFVQRQAVGDMAGLDKMLFGQASALTGTDIQVLAVVSGVALALVAVFYKEFLVISFNETFARVSGIPVRWFNGLFFLLLSFAIVASLQAVGVVLVSAMLITPAATAYMLTDRMHRLIALACVFGMLAGLIGCYLSFLGAGLPTGPFIVLVSSLGFIAAWFFSPRYGWVLEKLRRISRRRRMALENTLASIYRFREGEGHAETVALSLLGLSRHRNESLEEVESRLKRLQAEGFAKLVPSPRTAALEHCQVVLTAKGARRARTLIRNHRLWELYLNRAADYADDHVHDDAELMEHYLSEGLVDRLDQRLDYPRVDPHGRTIPSKEEARQ